MDKKQLAPSPTAKDIVLHLLTDKPVVNPTLHAWLAFWRSCILLIIINSLVFVTDAYTRGEPINVALFTIVLGPQVLYLLARSVQRAIAAIDSPLSPLLEAAANSGVTMTTNLLSRQHVKVPEVVLPEVFHEEEIPPGGTPA